MSKVRVKRAYDKPEESDGYRVLVDRIWPRGVSKEDLRIDHWAKDLAPSTELRKWFGHDLARWPRFKERYFAEIERNPEAVDALRAMVRKGSVTLVFAAKDERHNNAAALMEYLRNHPAA